MSAVSLGDAEGTATVDRAMAPSLISVGDSVGAAAILRGLGFNAISLGNNLGAATIDRAMRFGLITLGDALGSTEGEVPVGAIETSPRYRCSGPGGIRLGSVGALVCQGLKLVRRIALVLSMRRCSLGLAKNSSCIRCVSGRSKS